MPVLYDSGSSESILHHKLRYLCTYIQEREVSQTTVSSSDQRKVEVGEIDILVDSGTPVKVEVILLNLQEMKYNIKNIELPENWVGQ